MAGQLRPYDADDFATSLQGHMPTGPIWPRDPDTVQRQVYQALTPTYARNWQTAGALLVDVFPATAVNLLPEWESSTGLPDPCAGAEPTIALRQAQVVARLTKTSGPSLSSIAAFAATLGYAVSITEFAPSRFGPAFGQPFGGEGWASTWQVSAADLQVQPFAFGLGVFGDPFATWSNEVLRCELTRIKPAHTVLLLDFGGTITVPPPP